MHTIYSWGLGLGLWGFNPTFNNISVISWWSVLLVQETGVMIVGFTTTYAISAYHHYCCEFESFSW
jgi:hypothetical protein